MALTSLILPIGNTVLSSRALFQETSPSETLISVSLFQQNESGLCPTSRIHNSGHIAKCSFCTWKYEKKQVAGISFKILLQRMGMTSNQVDPASIFSGKTKGEKSTLSISRRSQAALSQRLPADVLLVKSKGAQIDHSIWKDHPPHHSIPGSPLWLPGKHIKRDSTSEAVSHFP